MNKGKKLYEHFVKEFQNLGINTKQGVFGGNMKVSLLNETLPIGLAHGIKLNKDIKEDQIITWKDVDYSLDDPTVSYRRSMEKNFRSLLD